MLRVCSLARAVRRADGDRRRRSSSPSLVGLPESLPRERRSTGGVGALLAHAWRRSTATPRFMGYALTSALVLRRLLRLPRPARRSSIQDGVRRLADDVQHPVRRQRRRHAGGERGQPPAARPLLAAAAARRRPGRLRGRRCRGARRGSSTGGLGLWALAAPLFVLVASLGLIIPDLHGAGPLAPPRGRRDRVRLLRHAAARARRPGDAAGRHRRHGHRDVRWRS